MWSYFFLIIIFYFKIKSEIQRGNIYIDVFRKFDQLKWYVTHFGYVLAMCNQK